MAAAICPKCGSPSDDPEFCSTCGATMAAPAPAQAAPPPGAAELCPVCGEARPGPLARYCDTCRYDFVDQRPFSADVPTAAPPPAAPALALALPAPAAAPAPPPATAWDAMVAVDLTLRRDDDPVPADTRARIFPLDLADHLLGRRSDGEDIHPEIGLADPGISRRHLRLLRTPEGLSVLDLGSMNGTRLNGMALDPNVPTALREGDQLTLGCWTRLTVRPR